MPVLLAYIWVGTPTMSVTLDAPDLVAQDAWVQTVELEACDGSVHSVGHDAALEVWEAVQLTMPSGDWCRVGVVWDGPVLLEQAGASADLSASTTWVQLDADGGTYDYALPGGAWVGDAPQLVVIVGS